MSREPTSPSTPQVDPEIIELATYLDSVLTGSQQAAVAPLVRRIAETSVRRRSIINMVQESLSQLRLDLKYLQFDLEATRRERDALRDKYEQL